MSLSLIFTGLMIASGVAGVALTVWGRVTPPETTRAKRAFVTLGGISVLCIIAAGTIGGILQSRLNDTIVRIGSNIEKLAAPADVDPRLNPNQILAAAASKIINQEDEIARLKTAVQKIEKPANGIYRDDVLLGMARGTINETPTQLIFQAIFAGGAGIDFSKPIEYGNFKLSCQPPGAVGQTGGMGAITETRYPNVQCEKTGRR